MLFELVTNVCLYIYVIVFVIDLHFLHIYILLSKTIGSGEL